MNTVAGPGDSQFDGGQMDQSVKSDGRG